MNDEAKRIVAEEHTHRDDCPWLALMRKAGLR